MNKIAPLHIFALICVAITTVYVIGMSIWLIVLLSSRSWCSPKETGGQCFDLLNRQLTALSINSYIDAGVVALCLLTLMVIVVAGGQLTFRGGRDGVEANIGSDRNHNGDAP